MLDESLKQRIRECIRDALSARHVPNEILAIAEVPRTLSGKKMELPIKRCCSGTRWRKSHTQTRWRIRRASPGSSNSRDKVASARPPDRPFRTVGQCSRPASESTRPARVAGGL